MDKCSWFGHKYLYERKRKLVSRQCKRCGKKETWDLLKSPFSPEWEEVKK